MKLEKFAEIISFLSGPFVWFPVFLIIFVLKTDLTPNQQKIIIPVLLLFLIILPFGLLYYFLKHKIISNLDITNRKERYLILSIFTILWLIAITLIYFLGSALMFNLFLILWLLVLIGTIITFFWKISLHLMINTGGAIIINFLFNWNLPYLYFLIPLVGWSRYFLKRHTFSQIIAGTILSGGFILVAFYFLKYI